VSTYFFSKGIFTSLSLLLLGRILLEILHHSDKTINPPLKRIEIIYSIAFGIFTVGSLLGLLLISYNDKFTKEDKIIINLKDIKISDIYRVKESDKLKFSGKILNLNESERKEVEITGKLFINGKLSDKKYYTIPI
jgi:hypothetical protein